MPEVGNVLGQGGQPCPVGLLAAGIKQQGRANLEHDLAGLIEASLWRRRARGGSGGQVGTDISGQGHA